MKHILIICNDEETIFKLTYDLDNNQLSYDILSNINDFNHKIDLNNYQLLIIDYLSIKENSLYLETVNKEHYEYKIIIINYDDCLEKKIKLLNNGIEECLELPYRFRELMARIKAIIRRIENNYQNNIIVSENIYIDKKQELLYKDNRVIILTNREYKIISFFSQNKDIIISKDDILCLIYGPYHDKDHHHIDSYLYRIKKKLLLDNLENIRGVGYILKR